MKANLTILSLLTLLNVNIFSQDSTIISVTKGNTWVYDLIYYGSSQADTLHGVLVKEIIGESTTTANIAYCDGLISQELSPVYQVYVMQRLDTVTSFDFEYWYADSSIVLQNSSWVYTLDFRYVFDNSSVADTMCFGPFYYDPWASFYLNLGTNYLWGTPVETQTWSVSYIFPGCLCDLGLGSEFTEYFGPLRYDKSSYYPWGFWGHTIAILRGAIIDGVVYGDTTVVSVQNENGHPISKFKLSQNYPNPYNPATTIKYSIPNSGNVSLKVFDILGKEVATLVNEEKPVGEYEVEFNGVNLTSGIYLYQLKAGSFVETKKMILLK